MADVRRMRPLLGTFVEIRVSGPDIQILEQALQNGYAAIAEVHRLMSIYDPESDVSRLNKYAYTQPVAIHPLTKQVLAESLRLFELSAGLFDPSVAGAMAADGLLPQRDAMAIEIDAAATAADISLTDDDTVSFARSLMIDFGGIAKGFAVDCAIDALIGAGVSSGIVNAGGDLRVFGERFERIHLRHPTQAHLLSPLLTLHNEALATSAPTFSRKRHRGAWISALRNPKTKFSCTHDISVSVRAPRCIHADALTKLVHVDPDAALHLMPLFSAEALVVNGAGELVDNYAQHPSLSISK